jgi:hypothetical protein
LNANNEDGWAPLPMYFGRVKGFRGHCSFWEFSDEELDWMIKNRGVYVHTVGASVAPMSLHAEDLDFPHDSLFHRVYYEGSIHPVPSAWVLVLADCDVPEAIMIDGRTLELSNKYAPKPCEWREHEQNGKPMKSPVIHPGDLFFRDATLKDAEARFQEIRDQIPKLAESLGQDLITTEQNVRQNSLRLPVLVRMLKGGKEEVIG